MHADITVITNNITQNHNTMKSYHVHSAQERLTALFSFIRKAGLVLCSLLAVGCFFAGFFAHHCFFLALGFGACAWMISTAIEEEEELRF